MNLHRLSRALIFIIGSIVGGLALAFVIVFVHPELLQRPVAALSPVSPTATATASPVLVNPPVAPSLASLKAGSDDASSLPANASATGSFAAAAHRASPAVVNISTQRLITGQDPSAFGQVFGDLNSFYRNRTERTLGSGVIIDVTGHIITNNHVVANADIINVELADGRVTRATIVGRDPDTDLALLSIQLKDLPIMPLGRSDELQVGDAVLAIGNPLGLSQTVTHGIVSATGRSQLGVATFENFIQTDAAINAGNSGGALINSHGELIGINTAVLNKGNGSNIIVEGIGFAIPVNLVRGVMHDILDHGRVIRGWIGIVPEEVDDEDARAAGLPRGGVLVNNMYINSPAVEAGLRIGDVITEVDGRSVRSAQDALSQIATRKPNTSVRLHLLRGHTEVDSAVHVTERPNSIRGT
jgi:serine peptidase DegS